MAGPRRLGLTAPPAVSVPSGRWIAPAGWAGLWGGRPPHPGLVLAALATAAVGGVPLLYVFYRAATGGDEVWRRLWATRIPSLLVSTLSLTAGVTLVAALLAVPLAWLVARTDLAGRNVWAWVAALPLVIPPYLGAFAYISIFGPRGVLEGIVRRWVGAVPETLGPAALYSFGGVTLVLGLFTYPYVYLLVLGALRRFNVSLEEAARAAGHGPWAVFRRVPLPLLRPAVSAGTLLVALYVLADFGAVSMLRYPTFTQAIYLQLIGRYDRSAAAALGAVLVAISVFLLWAEDRARGRARYYQTVGTFRPQPQVRLGRWRRMALAYVLGVTMASVGVPLGMVGYWTFRGLAAGVPLEPLWRAAAHSLGAAAGAAFLTVALAFPVAYLRARHGGPICRGLAQLAQSGYALPGVVAALALIFLFNRYLPWLYGTPLVVLTAYVIRFLPQALQAEDAALAQVSPRLEEAARSLGLGPLAASARVTLPLVAPGLAAGWSLVFVSGLKELSATLLLRPAGFETLPVRVWMQASEGFFSQAGPAALVLVLCSAPLLGVLLGRQHRGEGHG